jgi:hypothetical protein
MNGKLYKESRRDNDCCVCGKQIKAGQPIMLQMIDGNWEGWCPEHGSQAERPVKGQETPLGDVSSAEEVLVRLDALSSGISHDLSALLRSNECLGTELANITRLLTTLVAQGAK